MDSFDASNVYITGWTKRHTLAKKHRLRDRESSRHASATTVQNIPDAPDISTTCPYFHDLRHA
jgi:hypothetical protein